MESCGFKVTRRNRLPSASFPDQFTKTDTINLGETFQVRFQLQSEPPLGFFFFFFFIKKGIQLLTAGRQKRQGSAHLARWQACSSHAKQEVFCQMQSEFLFGESLTSQRRDEPLLHAVVASAGKSSHQPGPPLQEKTPKTVSTLQPSRTTFKKPTRLSVRSRSCFATPRSLSLSQRASE